MINEPQEIIYQDLITLTHGIELSFINIVDITVKLCKLVENINSVHGIEKKYIIVQCLHKYVENNVADVRNFKDRDILLAFIDNGLPVLIDTLIALDVGDIVIKQIKKPVKKWSCRIKK